MQVPPVASDPIATAVSGLQRATQTADTAATAIAGGPNGDTATNIVALNQAANDFAANAAVIKTISDTERKLIDIFA